MLAIARVLSRHPTLWPTAARLWRRTVPSAWWRHRPFLPLPSSTYVRFRLLTQYGDTEHPPEAADVVHYLRWCRQRSR